MNYYFIVNPHASSGKSLKIWHEIEQDILKEQVPFEVFFTNKKGDATSFASHICNNNRPCTIIAVGGDGTVNEVIDGLCHYEDISFGYIPTGSANDTVRGLSLYADPHKALMAILHPTVVKQLNVGLISNKEETHRFMVSTGIGFDAEVCLESFTSPFKKVLNKVHLGKLTYVAIALKKLIFLKTFSVTCLDEAGVSTTYPEIIFIAGMNLKYEGGGLMLCPDASYEDDYLDFCIVENMAKTKVLRILPLAYSGKHTQFDMVHIKRCKELTIKANKPIAVHTDGENWGFQEEIKVSLAPEKLSVIIS